MDAPPSSSLSSLPSNPPEYPDRQEKEYNDRLKEAREKVNQYGKQDDEDKTVKLLSVLLKELPEEGTRLLCKDINEAVNVADLRQLANSIWEGLIKPMKAKGITPFPTISPREGAIDSIGDTLVDLPDPVSRGSQSRLRNQCLRRDGYKCVLTGIYDTTSANQLFPREALPDIERLHLEAAHIFPFSLGEHTTGTQKERDLATIWNTIYRCFPSLVGRIDGGKINEPYNAIMLTHDIHFAFGNFQVAFEATDTEHTYVVKTYQDFPSPFFHWVKPNSRVTFVANESNIALPDPGLLKAHAALARVLNATGLGELIDRALRDQDEIGCLAADGSTDVRTLLLAF